MPGNRIYFDYNASAPLLDVAREAAVAALGAGNPSSVHQEGREARQIVEAARRDVAALVGAKADDVVFTSGATEAAAALITPDWTMGRSPLRVGRLYTAASDHPCVLKGGSMPEEARVLVPVAATGEIDLAALEEALAGHNAMADGLPLVAVHAANNETGVVQPMRRIAGIAKAAGGIAVFDAVQAAGKIPLDIAEVSADFLILSSHKIGGPKGIGAIVAAGAALMPKALIAGGGQERGHRGGTENVPGIAGFGAAARAARQAVEDRAKLVTLRKRLEAGILSVAPHAVIYGRDAAERLPNTVFFEIPGLKTETAQIAFDLAGIALSAGSACFSGKVGPSHVLKAMGFADSKGGLRASIGPATTLAEIDRFLAELRAIAGRVSEGVRRVA